jgi:hypothetical protein
LLIAFSFFKIDYYWHHMTAIDEIAISPFSNKTGQPGLKRYGWPV